MSLEVCWSTSQTYFILPSSSFLSKENAGVCTCACMHAFLRMKKQLLGSLPVTKIWKHALQLTSSTQTRILTLPTVSLFTTPSIFFPLPCSTLLTCIFIHLLPSIKPIYLLEQQEESRIRKIQEHGIPLASTRPAVFFISAVSAIESFGNQKSCLGFTRHSMSSMCQGLISISPESLSCFNELAAPLLHPCQPSATQHFHCSS